MTARTDPLLTVGGTLQGWCAGPGLAEEVAGLDLDRARSVKASKLGEGGTDPAAVWRLASQAVGLGWFEMGSDEKLDPSPELVALCGLESGEGLQSLADLMMRVPEGERSGVLQTLTAPVGPGSGVGLEFHLLRGDGEMLVVALRGEWLPTAPRRLRAVIAERSTQETSKLTELAERYRTLAEISPDIIIVHQGGVIVYANPATLDTLKARDASQVVGRPILDFFTPASRAAFLARVSAMKSSEDIAEFFEEQAVTLDGEVVDIEATSIPTRWDGRPAFQAVARVITERKAAHRQLQYQAALIDAVSDAIVVHEGSTAADLRVASWSCGAQRIYGWSEEEAMGRRAEDLVLVETGSWRVMWDQAVVSGMGLHETAHRRKDGTTFPVHVSATVMRDESGDPTGLITVCTDISRRTEAEAARRELEDHYSAVVAALEEGVIVLGEDQRIRAANAAAERIFGAPAGDLIGTTLQDGPWLAVSEQGVPLLDHQWPPLQALSTGRPVSNAVIGLVCSGVTTWISINARPLHRGQRGFGTIVCSVSDITASKAAKDDLNHAASHDALTGLANRAGIARALDALDPGDREISALFVDVDHFKEINDSLGHAAGDQLLRALADRISGAVRGKFDIVGRLAGDEFVVICRNASADDVVDDLADRLLDSIRRPVQVTDSSGMTHSVSVTASIGVAHLRPDRSAADLLVDADVAMYSAKENGRSQIRVFDETLRRRARNRMEIREDLARAVEGGHLRLDYQPVVSAAGEIIGYESLARWDHPVRGPVPPSDFIPIAEENGLIISLGEWVLDQSAATAKRLQTEGRPVFISVNLSAKQVTHPRLVHQVVAALEKHDLDPGSLCFEITESSVMRDTSTATANLRAIRRTGTRIAIDDFGTGYSSLAYLEQFPIDALKIDRSFVSVLEERRNKPTVIAGIVSLGRSLDLTVVAEGVETPLQARALMDLKVDAMQGYLFGRPGPV